MSIPILATKLYIPPPRPKAVLRPRLIERLNVGLDQNQQLGPNRSLGSNQNLGQNQNFGRKLSLISAPAGFGKITLVVEPLSERELEVLQLIAEGLTNPEITSRLFLALNTIKAHTRNIYGKLGVHSRTQAVARARVLEVLSSA